MVILCIYFSFVLSGLGILTIKHPGPGRKLLILKNNKSWRAWRSVCCIKRSIYYNKVLQINGLLIYQKRGLLSTHRSTYHLQTCWDALARKLFSLTRRFHQKIIHSFISLLTNIENDCPNFKTTCQGDSKRFRQIQIRDTFRGSTSFTDCTVFFLSSSICVQYNLLCWQSL